MRAWSRGRGFTLLEMMAALAVAALLMSIAVPSYFKQIERVKINRATRDLAMIAASLERYRSVNVRLPLELAELSGLPTTDPWGHAYVYLSFAAPIPGIKGLIRKDHNLHPLNTEFDLYSLGADGESRPALTAKKSQDDVIWARDGSFIGLARDF